MQNKAIGGISMEQNIKESYEKIKMPKDSKEKVYEQIVRSADAKKNNEQHGSRRILHTWKVGVAVCLAIGIILPTSVYAVQRIAKYHVEVSADNYQAEIHLQKEAEGGKTVPTGGGVSQSGMQYITIEADFGSNYKYMDDSVDYIQEEGGKLQAKKHKIKEGADGMYSYAHKDGFRAGKDFYYEVIYMDASEDALNLYDQANVKEISVNNHRALLCETNTVQGSRYTSDHDTDYNLDLYVFYEEYGYIINFCGMQGLGKKSLIELAGKIKVAESTKSGASRYINLRLYHKANMQSEPAFKKDRVSAPIKSMEESVKADGITYQVMDVKVSSKIKDTDLTKYSTCSVSSTRSISKLWKKDGTLKTYTRENIVHGDGMSSPASTVSGTEQVQLKMVYVTMKVKIGRQNELFSLPAPVFFEKEGDSYFDTALFWHYNRPERIEDAMMESCCYFKETEGGAGFRIKDMKAGEEAVYHFGYLVDEDLVDNMFLGFGSTEVSAKYMRIG